MYDLENVEIEIDLKDLFGVLKSKILIILATTVAFIAVSAGITRFLITPMYSSTAQLYVISNDSLSQLSNLTVGTQLTQDYMAIVTTRGVVNKVIDNLDLNMDYEELTDKISVENPTDTRIMEITVSHPNPKEAREITQELAEVTAKTVSSKMDIKAPAIIEDAYLATEPDSPSMLRNVAIGGFLGLILSAGIFIIRFIMNDTIRREEDIEKYLGINTLAKLPLANGEKKRTKKVRKVQE